jgi:DNA segregation ATPase FtsK/SpoIIIE-like protein
MAGRDERLQHRLEIQAMQIERLMSKHGVPVEVTGGSVRDEGVYVDARALVSAGKERLQAVARELTRVFGVDNVELERSDGGIRFRYRKRPRNAIELLALLDMVSVEDGLSIPLGLDLDARPLLLRLDDFEGGNILIAGGESSGATSLLRTIVAATALKARQPDVQLLILSGSGNPSIGSRYSLAPLEHFPHCTAPVQKGYQEAVEALHWLVEEAAFRETYGIERPLLLLIIDDLDSLLFAGEEEVANLVGRLLEVRAAAGIRTIIAIHDVMSPEVRALMRRNVGLRLVGRVRGARDSRAATGIAEAGAEHLRGAGDFLAVSGREAIRFQAAFRDDYDLHAAIEQAYSRSRRALLALPLEEARPELPTEADDGKQILFKIDNGSGRVVIEPPAAEDEWERNDRAGADSDSDSAKFASKGAGTNADHVDDDEWPVDRDEFRPGE